MGQEEVFDDKDLAQLVTDMHITNDQDLLIQGEPAVDIAHAFVIANGVVEVF